MKKFTTMNENERTVFSNNTPINKEIEYAALIKQIRLRDAEIERLLAKQIESEKQHIIEAYNQGYRDGESIINAGSSFPKVSKCINAIHYYNQKYKP